MSGHIEEVSRRIRELEERNAELEKRNAALELSEERFRTLFDSSNNAHLILDDASNGIIDCNAVSTRHVERNEYMADAWGGTRCRELNQARGRLRRAAMAPAIASAASQPKREDSWEGDVEQPVVLPSPPGLSLFTRTH